MNKFLKVIVASILALSVAGCQSTLSTTAAASLPDEKSVNAGARSHIHPESAQAVTTLKVQKPVIEELQKVSNDALPETMVGPFAAADMRVIDLIDAIAYETGVGFAFESTTQQDVGSRKLSLVDPQKMSFKKAIEKISSASNLFWSYENEILRFETERSFRISVPNVVGTASEFVKALESVGAKGVKTDKVTGGVIFNADPITLRKVKSLADGWADNRTMIVYDSYIYEVNLKQSAQSGLSIDSLNAKLGKLDVGVEIASGAATAPGGMALTLAGVSGNIAIEAITSSINENGRYKVLSQPTISVFSGGESTLDIGEKQQYISSISNTTTQNGNSSQINQNIDVSSIETGLQMSISGQYSGGMIVTDLDLRLATLLGFEEFESGEGTMKLPNTAERKIEQTLLARPGDVLVLAGVMTSRTGKSESGSAVVPMFGKRSNSSEKTELIIVLRPRIVKFVSE